eukprot:GFUD01020928.1.p1 GENE.GFUD01020928.1~~GFUD01020928.1.p1  ORF type:complete len:434 (+),score=122.62 GFUD01020928.1:79-1302(+)
MFKESTASNQEPNKCQGDSVVEVEAESGVKLLPTTAETTVDLQNINIPSSAQNNNSDQSSTFSATHTVGEIDHEKEIIKTKIIAKSNGGNKPDSAEEKIEPISSVQKFEQECSFEGKINPQSSNTEINVAINTIDSSSKIEEKKEQTHEIKETSNISGCISLVEEKPALKTNVKEEHKKIIDPKPALKKIKEPEAENASMKEQVIDPKKKEIVPNVMKINETNDPKHIVEKIIEPQAKDEKLADAISDGKRIEMQTNTEKMSQTQTVEKKNIPKTPTVQKKSEPQPLISKPSISGPASSTSYQHNPTQSDIKVKPTQISPSSNSSPSSDASVPTPDSKTSTSQSGQQTSNPRKRKADCPYFGTAAKCHKGSRCDFYHDMKKIQCREFRLGRCRYGSACRFRHDYTYM